MIFIQMSLLTSTSLSYILCFLFFLFWKPFLIPLQNEGMILILYFPISSLIFSYYLFPFSFCSQVVDLFSWGVVSWKLWCCQPVFCQTLKQTILRKDIGNKKNESKKWKREGKKWQPRNQSFSCFLLNNLLYMCPVLWLAKSWLLFFCFFLLSFSFTSSVNRLLKID